MARKSRKAARGRHNKNRLRRINDLLSANGVAAQSTLTKAEAPYKQLLAKKREAEIPKSPPIVEIALVNEKRQKYLDKKQKRQARKEQSLRAKDNKLTRTIVNQSQNK